jgi:hypothetical protein
MPVTAGHVPGATSRLRRVSDDPGRFRNGRWFLLAQGVLVSALGIAGLVAAALHPHAGPARAPFSGLASTPAHSAILLALGVVAIAAVRNRRAAVIVTALSAVGYLMLLFISSVGAARTMPTPAGLGSAGILLHGVLGSVNLALLMWLIPDELGDPVWVPRRRRGRRDRREPSAPEAVADSAAASASMVSGTNPESPAPTADAPGSDGHASTPQHAMALGQSSRPASTNPPVSIQPPRRALPEQQSQSQELSEASAHNVENSTQAKRLAVRATATLAVPAAVIGIVIWRRRR